MLEPLLQTLRNRGISYRGVIYAGLMLTPDGPQVIEFNCRFGDPECQTLMPLLEGDLAALMLACAEGRLAQAPPLTIRPLCSACVVAAAGGYPDAPRLDDEVHDEGQDDHDRRLFHAGIRRDRDGRLRTSGGRVLAAVAEADDFDAAFAAAYARLAAVSFAGMQVRRDIGHQVRRF